LRCDRLADRGDLIRRCCARLGCMMQQATSSPEAFEKGLASPASGRHRAVKNELKKKPPVSDRGQVNREASRLGDAGAIDPLPTHTSRKTGSTAAVFDDNTLKPRRCVCQSPKAGSRHVLAACPGAHVTAGHIGRPCKCKGPDKNWSTRSRRRERSSATRSWSRGPARGATMALRQRLMPLHQPRQQEVAEYRNSFRIA
jgi:hypothetical protein